MAEPGDAGVELRREGYSDEEVRRILDRAGRLQQRVERGTSPGILRESAAEVGLRREYVDQAMAELAAERAQRDRSAASCRWWRSCGRAAGAFPHWEL